jgi:hypothetical protein
MHLRPDDGHDRAGDCAQRVASSMNPAANDRCIYGGEDCETDPCLSPGGGLITRKPVTSPVPPESSISLRPARK